MEMKGHQDVIYNVHVPYSFIESGVTYEGAKMAIVAQTGYTAWVIICSRTANIV
jgi:hypothetical protein